MFTRICLLFLCVYSCTVCAQPYRVITAADRARARDEWITAAADLAAKTQDAEALSIVAFLKENNLLGQPIPTGARFLESKRLKHWFMIAPLFEADTQIPGQWTAYTHVRDAAAHFLPSNRTIIIKVSHRMTPLWKGMIMLHEGRHAMTYITHPYDVTNHQAFCNQERDTHEFQNRIMTKLGGTEYERLLAKVSADIEADAKKEASLSTGIGAAHFIVPQSHEYREFDAVFGDVLSSTERAARDTHIWVHAHFQFLERALGPDRAPKQKSLLLFTIYLKNGVLKR